MTPDKLADELGVSGKTIRAWLRENYKHEFRTRWVLTEEQAAAVRSRFGTAWLRAESREGMVITTVALPASDHRQLTEAAEHSRASITELIRQAVRDWLKRHGPGRNKR